MSKSKPDWTYELGLKHGERPAILIPETGEVKEIKPKPGGRPGFKYFNQGQVYTKTYTKAWNLLKTQTTPLEYFVAHQLALRAKMGTNSLIPLSPDTTVRDLVDTLGGNKNNINKIIDKLFSLGVIGKFEVSEVIEGFDTELKKYWIFNPFLSFNGKVVNKGVEKLFENTYYAMAFKLDKNF